MRKEALSGKWEKEPTFPATGSQKPDGTYCAYFCHLIYDGEHTQTVRVEEMADNTWEAIIEDIDGETVHRMSTEYSSPFEAVNDAADWASGQ